MNIDITDPAKLHQYLQVAMNQRKRQKVLFEQQFGPGSAPANAAQAEMDEIGEIQRACTKALADKPHSGRVTK